MDRLSALACVPLLNRAVVLHAGITAHPGALGDFIEQIAGILLFKFVAGSHGAGPPVSPVERGLHELITHSHGEVLVLVHHAPVGVAVVGAVVTLLDQSPCLLFLDLLGVDELLNVAVPVADGVHLGGTTRFAAGLHDVSHLVVDAEERHRAAGRAAAADGLALRADGREIGAGAGAKLKQHPLAVSELQDGLHVVVDRLDETGTALRKLVLRRGAFRLAKRLVVMPVTLG